MEGEDEEFEGLLEEILQATESTGHKDDLEPSPFHTFKSNSDIEEGGHGTGCTFQDHSTDSQTFMGLHTTPKAFKDFEKEITRFMPNNAAADASLTMIFDNLNLELGDHMEYDKGLGLHHRLDGLLHTQAKFGSTYGADKAPDGFVSGANQSGSYGHNQGRCVGGFGHGSKYAIDSKGRDLHGLHEVSGIQVMHQPFTYGVPIQQSLGDAGVTINDRFGWRFNPEMVACLQAQELFHVNAEAQKRREEVHDQVFAVWEGYSQKVSGARFSGMAHVHGPHHGDYHSIIGGALYSGSCAHQIQQNLFNSHADDFCTCGQAICRSGDGCSLCQGTLGGPKLGKVLEGWVPLHRSGVPRSASYNEKGRVRILSRKSSSNGGAALGVCCVSDSNNREMEGVPMTLLGQENNETKGSFHLADAQECSLSSLAEIKGCILSVAKDQHGCRFLQKKFDEGALDDLEKIFGEVLGHAADLMADPFGNYLMQKLLEVCSDDQRLKLLEATRGELVNVSLNMHGTRAVQKLIETLKSRQQVAIVIASLRSRVVTLIKDLNGNHVIQCCLQHLSNDDNMFIFEAAAQNIVEIGTHRHGCCVLQRCIDHSTGVSKKNLIQEIASHSLQLSQDSFGNYVVQYVLELRLPWAIREVINHLVRNFARLSMQKFSSNVVEKCLKLSEEESRACIIQEIIHYSRLSHLLLDPYANYVIQSALLVSKGSLHARLVEAIRPHIPSLRNNPYGKRILSRRSLKRS